MTVLVGTATDHASNDFEVIGVLIGSSFVASATGTADTISLRTDSGNSFAGTIFANIYTDASGTPGSKIGTDVSLTVTSGAHLFTSTSGLNAALTAGTTYWIIFAGQGSGSSQWTFSAASGGTTKDTGAGHGTLPLPSSWPGTVGTFTETMDAYAETAVGGGGGTTVKQLAALGVG